MELVSSKSSSDVGAPLERTSFVVVSDAMTELLAMAKRAAESAAPILITGESGVGKDLLARYIHSQSSRRHGPFVTVKCAGLIEARLESELFGHVSQHVTDAFLARRGRVRLADRGTLFLDQAGDMIRRMQGWLLRFLETGEIQAGDSDDSPSFVDVRVIAATNRNLSDLVAAGQFREDLLYRLRVIHLHVTPLRDRPDDIEVLIRHFLKGSGRELSFTDDALRALMRYSWPGNVREVQNLIEQTVYLSPGGVVDVEHLPVSIRAELGEFDSQLSN